MNWKYNWSLLAHSQPLVGQEWCRELTVWPGLLRLIQEKEIDLIFRSLWSITPCLWYTYRGLGTVWHQLGIPVSKSQFRLTRVNVHPHCRHNFQFFHFRAIARSEMQRDLTEMQRDWKSISVTGTSAQFVQTCNLEKYEIYSKMVYWFHSRIWHRNLLLDYKIAMFVSCSLIKTTYLLFTARCIRGHLHCICHLHTSWRSGKQRQASTPPPQHMKWKWP